MTASLKRLNQDALPIIAWAFTANIRQATTGSHAISVATAHTENVLWTIINWQHTMKKGNSAAIEMIATSRRTMPTHSGTTCWPIRRAWKNDTRWPVPPLIVIFEDDCGRKWTCMKGIIKILRQNSSAYCARKCAIRTKSRYFSISGWSTTREFSGVPYAITPRIRSGSWKNTFVLAITKFPAAAVTFSMLDRNNAKTVMLLSGH